MTKSTPKHAGLYPFLQGDKASSKDQNSALLQSVNKKAADSIATKQRFFDQQGQALIDAAQSLADVFRNKHRVFSMGNGGSSCDASHFSVEFQHPVTAGRPALPTMNLTMDTAMISAVANDVGIDQVFARQVEAHGHPGDALVGFSTSGNSHNLMNAFRQAKRDGLVCLGFCGGDGGDMLKSGLLDHCLRVESDSIHRIQEVHVACYHIIWDLVHTLLADTRGACHAVHR